MKNRIRICVALSCLFLSVLPLSACNKKGQIVSIVSPQRFIQTYTFGDGIKSTEGLTLFRDWEISIATNKKLEKIRLQDTIGHNLDLNGGHFISLDYYNENPSPTETHKGFNIYNCKIDKKILSSNLLRETATIGFSNPTFICDGIKVQNKSDYYVTFYEDDSLLINYSVETKTKDLLFTCKFGCVEDIEIQDISQKFFMILDIDKEKVLPQFPFTLSAEKELSFSFTAEIKPEMPKYGSGFFEVTYRKVGEDKIRKSPVGYFAIEPEADYIYNAIDNL